MEDALTVRLTRAWCDQLAAAEPRLDELLAGDAIVHGLATHGGPVHGAAEAETAIRKISSLFAERSCQIHDTFASGDRIAVRWAIKIGSGRGDWRAANGEVPGMTILRIADGRIAEAWMNFGRWWV
jgi:hypothetical protein